MFVKSSAREVVRRKNALAVRGETRVTNRTPESNVMPNEPRIAPYSVGLNFGRKLGSFANAFDHVSSVFAKSGASALSNPADPISKGRSNTNTGRNSFRQDAPQICIANCSSSPNVLGFNSKTGGATVRDRGGCGGRGPRGGLGLGGTERSLHPCALAKVGAAQGCG